MRKSPPQSVVLDQRRAARPDASAWVTANAGSGKTTVLARRVLRLLLAGARPSRLLCLTFTKAAAANMQNRVFATLGRWALADDVKLDAELLDLTGRPADADDRARARRLFAEAIETPGGLKILTIHGFCERLLRVFPFEANVPAGFSVLDSQNGRDMLARARAAVVEAGLAAPSAPVGRALARAVEEVQEANFADLMDKVAQERDAIGDLVEKHGGVDRAAAALARALGLAPGETVQSVENAMLNDGIPAAEWSTFAEALCSTGGANDRKAGEAFAAAAATLDRDERLSAYCRPFLTKDGEVRSARNFASKALQAAFPDLAARLTDERDRFEDLVERLKAARLVERSHAILVLAIAMIEAYVAEKARHAVLDFDDLVTSAADLLTRAGADWVLFKLDQGIDHILVDEAQDTSPEQWTIVEALTEEFFAGAGARLGATRTMFAVGDEKQSIFSFQGAAPDSFARMRRRFESRARDAAQLFEPVRLHYSFRSAETILRAVDLVFSDPENRRGLSDEEAPPHHQTVRSGEPGLVEVWPVESPSALPAVEAWDAAVDETGEDAPVARLARRIAATVAGWTGRDGGNDPGDVMILVRSRNALFEGIIRALKQAGVPVAGADRLVLTQSIAVMDLLALARFALLPDDDLTLATVLKSPLVGLDDDDLLRLAPGRSGSLWEAIVADPDPRSMGAVVLLRRWIEAAVTQAPFDFYAGILARDGGRRAFLARLGSEAGDALDEFLASALAYESANTPSLQGFLAWFAAAGTEVKRDMDVARGEVRVMTVHGAKGLESKIVILADTCTSPTGRHDPPFFFAPDPAGPDRLAPLFLWAKSQKLDTPLAAAHRSDLRSLAEAEHRRLLYVAMTRAEDRLVVAGFQGKSGRPAGCWYDMIASSLEAAGGETLPMEVGEGERLVLRDGVAAAAGARADAPRPTSEPDWLRRPVAAERPAATPIRPSLAEEEALPETAFDRVGDDWPVLRGRLVHRLLQWLPEATGDREAIALRFLERTAPRHPERHAGVVRDVMRLLSEPDLAPLFAAGSRAEVSVAGKLARKGRPDLIVTGRIDRLAVGERDVLIVDFKTNNAVPDTPAAAPAAYVAQLALYRAVLSRLYPRHAVRAALVWTRGPIFMQLPDAILDEALALTLAG